MNEHPAKIRKPWRWRRLVQYRLRTLLLLMFASAVGVWLYQYYHARRPFVVEIPGGMKLSGPPEIAIQDPSEIEKTGKPERLVVHDRYGRAVCQGVYLDGVAVGPWVYYHSNGRPAFSGRCSQGCRSGVWTAWDERGRKVAEIQHGPPITGFDPIKGRDIAPRSQRTGTASQWWGNGQLRSTGQFQQDHPHGQWAFCSAAGDTTAAGEYFHGERLGAWTATGSSPPVESITADFVFGRQVTSLAVWLEACARALASDDWRARYDAVEALPLAGPRALPQWRLALRSPHREVVVAALRAVQRLGPQAHPALPEIDETAQSPEPEVASEALLTAFVVDEANRRERLSHLMQFLAKHLNDQNVHLLRRLAMALGPQRAALLQPFFQDLHAEVRLIAVVILGDLATHCRSPGPGVDENHLAADLARAAQHYDPRVAAHAQSVLDALANRRRGGSGMGGGMF